MSQSLLFATKLFVHNMLFMSLILFGIFIYLSDILEAKLKHNYSVTIDKKLVKYRTFSEILIKIFTVSLFAACFIEPAIVLSKHQQEIVTIILTTYLVILIILGICLIVNEKIVKRKLKKQ